MTRSDELAEHLAYFAELGVAGVSRDRAWRVRPAAAAADAATDPGAAAAKPDAPAAAAPAAREPAPAAHREPAPASAAAPASAPAAASAGQPLEISMFDQVAVPEAASAADRLRLIREELGDCTRCKLHAGRKTLVYGVGSPDAKLMFVGEAPGRDEDLQGIPFVGRAGQLLTRIIESIDLRREDVYIANVIKCRPPGNRNPTPDEVRTCEPFLFAQVDAIRPRVIVALGTFAARTLLRTEEPISRLRGRVFDYRGAQLVPTFHPAFLLRSPDRKRDVWEDMKKIRTMLRAG